MSIQPVICAAPASCRVLQGSVSGHKGTAITFCMLRLGAYGQSDGRQKYICVLVQEKGEASNLHANKIARHQPSLIRLLLRPEKYIPGSDLVADGGSGIGVVAISSSIGCSTVKSSVSSGCRLDLTALTNLQNK